MKVVLFILIVFVLVTYFAIGFIAELRSPGVSMRGDSKFSMALGKGIIWGLVLVVTYQDMYRYDPRPGSMRQAWRAAWNDAFGPGNHY